MLAAPIFVILWSTGFVGAKYGLPHAEPMTFLTIRFFIVAALMGVWAVMAREFDGAPYDWAGAMVIGVLIQAIYLGGVFTSIWLGVGAALAALIVGLQPIFTALFARAMLGEELRPVQWLGMALGLGGVALVVWRRLDAGAIGPEGAALCLIGMAAASLGSVLQKRRDREPRLARDMTAQFLAAGVFTGVAALAFEEFYVDWTAEFLGAMAWMVLALSVGAVSLLYFLIRRGGVSRISSMFFLVPGCTALMAWAMFGETFGLSELAGVGVAAIGVALVTQPGRAST